MKLRTDVYHSCSSTACTRIEILYCRRHTSFDCGPQTPLFNLFECRGNCYIG